MDPIGFGEVGAGPALPGSLAPRPQSLQRTTPVRWSDLTPADNWAKPAIAFVGGANTWMRDYRKNADGTYPFKPNTVETRMYLARAMVRAFAPSEEIDPSITFTDFASNRMLYRYANVAVKLGWMRRGAGSTFLPEAAVNMATLHRAIVTALRDGLPELAGQLDALHTESGVAFDTPANFGTTMIGMLIGLRYNSSVESKDVNPRSPMPRAQVAYSLYRSKTLSSWVVPNLISAYDGIQLPIMGPVRRAIVQWGVRFVGYPYVYAGEWGFASSQSSALGGQPVPGFDCSGFTWWALRASDNGSWDVSPPRPYAGWALPERSSADMSRTGNIKFTNLIPGDLMFYASSGVVDHVNVYIGNGFALDSSSSNGGVAIVDVTQHWYRDNFVHGRRIVPAPRHGAS
jgi:cell wall-associated NlpC family hydrolase